MQIVDIPNAVRDWALVKVMDSPMHTACTRLLLPHIRKVLRQSPDHLEVLESHLKRR
jgi:hypothetical protein